MPYLHGTFSVLVPGLQRQHSGKWNSGILLSEYRQQYMLFGVPDWPVYQVGVPECLPGLCGSVYRMFGFFNQLHRDAYVHNRILLLQGDQQLHRHLPRRFLCKYNYIILRGLSGRMRSLHSWQSGQLSAMQVRPIYCHCLLQIDIHGIMCDQLP